MQLEPKPRRSESELRVVVVAPTGRDGSLLCAALSRAGIEAVECRSCAAACREMEAGAGCVVVAEEALGPADIQRFAELMAAQPPWSDFPLIVLTLSGEVTAQSQRRRRLRIPLARALELERPVRPETLVSTVEGALRSRRRQYQLRDHIQQRKETEEALRRTEKLAVAGRLAASIAHEINNPLEAVTNLVYLARTSEALEECRGFLKLAEAELARVSEITTGTLKFYRQSQKASELRISEVLDSLLALYRQKLLSARVKVETDYRDQRPIVAYGGELRQMLSNLVANAIEASTGARVKIRLRRTRDRAGREGVRIVVADNGVGIPEDIKHCIFEPFISTKGARGTGLGLWVTSGIVSKHGGTIRVKSCTGTQRHGTVFSVFLPAEPAAAAAASAPSESSESSLAS